MNFLKNLATTGLVAATAIGATVLATPAQAALIGGAGCSTNASSYSLAAIVNNNCSVQIGDKLFSNFAANAVTTGTGQISSLADFKFQEVDNGNGGIGFNLLGIWQASGGAGVADLGLTYKVSVLPGFNKFINGAIASVTGGGTSGGIVGLIETINPGPGQGTLNLNSADGALGKLIAITATKSIEVSKNIRAVSTGALGSEGHISIIRDVYTQTDVPTPALIPGIAAMGMGLLRRKKAQAVAA